MPHPSAPFRQSSQRAERVPGARRLVFLCLLAPLLTSCSEYSGSGMAGSPTAVPSNPRLLPPSILRAAATDSSTIDAADNLHVQVVSSTGADRKHYLDAHDVIRTTFSFGSQEYHILSGDTLSIQFQENSKLDLNVTVRPDGRLTLPGLGEIVAAGQTPLALAKQINETYSERMNRPDASVTVVKADTAPIDSLSTEYTIRPDGFISIPLLGEVKAAGRTPAELADQLTGIASTRFKNNILAYVTTRERSTLQETLPGSLIGYDKMVTVSSDGLLILPEIGAINVSGKTLAQVRSAITKAAELRYKRSLLVAVTIEPSEHRSFFVSGEVTKPGAYPLSGTMTAVKALAVAGGLTQEANLRGVVLMHYNPDSSITVYLTSVKAVVGNGSAFTDIALSPQDVIFVPKTMIAQADLFVQQYLEKLIPVGRSVSYSYTTFPKL